MRVSERQRYNLTSNRVEGAKDKNSKMLEQMSTQKTINHLSDDPVNLTQVVKERKKVRQFDQFQRSINYAKGYLERAEGAIAGIQNFLIRAKELSVSMANDTYGHESRYASSREIKEVMEAIVSLANTTYGNRYVFGGYRTLTPPISKDGEFLGDDGGIFIQIGENDFKQVNINARSMFEATLDEREDGHFDLLHGLNVLYQGLRDDDVPQIRVAMEELEFQLDKVSNYQAKIGSIWNGLEAIDKQLVRSKDETVGTISTLEDTDMFKASSDFKRTEQVLQSTLLASNKLLQPSLLNFLQ